MKKTNCKNIHVQHRMRYTEEINEYGLQLVHRRSYWWWLPAFLLPLLLFIKCEKDITVTCYEPEADITVADVPVTLTYQSHRLYHQHKFFTTDSINRCQTTDSLGQTTFQDIPCSVFSYVCYCLSKMTLSTRTDCHATVDENYFFHFRRNITLKLHPRREDLHLQLLDGENNEGLPNGKLIYKYQEGIEERTDSIQADAAGAVTIPQMRYCGKLTSITGSCYGYADTTFYDLPCANLLVANDSAVLKLRPVKDRFTFYVKNEETKQPIPNALCTVKLTSPGGSTTTNRDLRTSIDGKGIAAYENAFILSTIDITATKLHYKNGHLKSNRWSVEEFNQKDKNTRTIWLTPEPYLVEYINIDSINGNPIPGVKNDITITDPSGNTEKISEISNRNGVFPVTAKEGSKIEIISTLDPIYHTKRTFIGTFKDKEKVRMYPKFDHVKLQTVQAKTGFPLLPQCDLNIHGSVSGRLQPYHSGNGNFTVKARVNDKLSITASKKDYLANHTTVRNTPLSKLKQGKKIPLELAPISYEYNKAVQGVTKDCYDLKEAPATFRFTWQTCEICTMITVTDAKGGILGRFGIDSPNGDGRGMIYSTPSGTTLLSSNTSTICISVQNTNGHTCIYRIEK